MNRVFYLPIVSALMAVFITFNAFAMPYNPNNYTSVDLVSELLSPSVKQSKGTAFSKARGDFFARADLFIRDNGNGNISATAAALTRYPVDEAYITIYLDRWDTDAEKWRQINSYEAEFYAKDYPDGLTFPSVDLVFPNNERGCYYRLRSVFAVIYQEKMEAFSPTTDGILLE